jgi:hypothetical protein
VDERGISRVKTDLSSLYLDDLSYDPDLYKDQGQADGSLLTTG